MSWRVDREFAGSRWHRRCGAIGNLDCALLACACAAFTAVDRFQALFLQYDVKLWPSRYFADHWSTSNFLKKFGCRGAGLTTSNEPAACIMHGSGDIHIPGILAYRAATNINGKILFLMQSYNKRKALSTGTNKKGPISNYLQMHDALIHHTHTLLRKMFTAQH